METFPLSAIKARMMTLVTTLVEWDFKQECINIEKLTMQFLQLPPVGNDPRNSWSCCFYILSLRWPFSTRLFSSSKSCMSTKKGSCALRQRWKKIPEVFIQLIRIMCWRNSTQKNSRSLARKTRHKQMIQPASRDLITAGIKRVVNNSVCFSRWTRPLVIRFKGNALTMS